MFIYQLLHKPIRYLFQHKIPAGDIVVIHIYLLRVGNMLGTVCLINTIQVAIASTTEL